MVVFGGHNFNFEFVSQFYLPKQENVSGIGRTTTCREKALANIRVRQHFFSVWDLE
jgi:hypothetical protein